MTSRKYSAHPIHRYRVIVPGSTTIWTYPDLETAEADRDKHLAEDTFSYVYDAVTDSPDLEDPANAGEYLRMHLHNIRRNERMCLCPDDCLCHKAETLQINPPCGCRQHPENG